MRWEVLQKPSYTILKVSLERGESVTAEPGAMVLMRGPIRIQTGTGGLGKGILRAMLGGESLFLNTYVAEGPSEVWLAPSFPGDIAYFPLSGTSLIIQDTSYLAHHGNVSVGVSWRGFRGLLAEGSLVWLKAEGYGGVWVNSFGAIEQVELREGERVTVDNFHLVAMSEGVKWKVRKFGGIKSFVLGGEGIVMELEGPGIAYIQTRSLPPFVDMLRKFFKS